MHNNGPLHMVRGEGSHLYNDQGQEFLDCVNNVAHVGHCHPKVCIGYSFSFEGRSSRSPAQVLARSGALASQPPAPLAAGVARAAEASSADLRLGAGDGSGVQAAGHAEHECALHPPWRGRLCRGGRQDAAARALRTPPSNVVLRASCQPCLQPASGLQWAAQRGFTCRWTLCKQPQIFQVFPGSHAPLLQVSYYQTSGSEANDLALRICKIARPGARHVAVMGGAYHGMTTASMQMSPYKFDSPGGTGQAEHIHILPCPDTYRCC